MMKVKKIAFVADPLENFNPDAETTLQLMKEAARRHWQIYHTEPKQLVIEDGKVKSIFKQLQITSGKKFYKVMRQKKMGVQYFDYVFLRKDPPFDLDYLHHLQLLNLAADQTQMVNDPMGIMVAAEKLIPLYQSEHCPETLVAASEKELLNFIKHHQQGVVLKPLGLAGGQGILLQKGIAGAQAQLQSITQNFTRHIVAQEYLPAVKLGDKRILLWDGEPLGAFIRKAKPGNFVSNLHAGGTAHSCTITKQETHLLQHLQSLLAHLGLRFVGIDLIGGKLTEINVTSPMGIKEINNLYNLKVEKKILDSLIKGFAPHDA